MIGSPWNWPVPTVGPAEEEMENAEMDPEERRGAIEIEVEEEGLHQTTSATYAAWWDIGKKTYSTLFMDTRKTGQHGFRGFKRR